VSGQTAGPVSLSATRLEHIDAVCDRFEREWRAGGRPRIEEYLAKEAEPTLSVLLHEILLAELDWRRRLGESPEPMEYLGRFPTHASVVEAAFAGPSRTGRLADPGLDPSGTDSGRMHDTSRRFRILRPLAEGGLGVVSVARDGELHREVALKEIQPRLASQPESRVRFLREAEITGRLEHPGIVPVYSLGRYPDGRPYYAMRLIEGTSLKQAIADFHQSSALTDAGARTLALRKLLDRFRGVCEALAYAHSRGVVHRDVKPQNIMVGRFGETLLVDWGLAKATGQPDANLAAGSPPIQTVDSDGTDETAAGSAVGTPSYMSPEQAEGSTGQSGPASDVYGLGATLYHLLTGRPPFEGGLREVVDRVRSGDFPTPRSVRHDIPRPLEAVCLKAMARSPEDRYPSVNALADDLERWLADEPVSAWREPLRVRALRWIKRHRTPVIAALSAVLLTALVFGGCVVLYCLEHMHITWFIG
jgi:serine/threonine-protein kinase